MKTIIAPTDFSTVSENACLYAAKLAADVKANLVLFHAMELPMAVAEYPVAEDVFDEAEVEKELEALKNKLSAETNNKVRINIKNIVGSAEYEIGELCKTAKPFAIVMGSHGYGALDRFFLGSTTIYTTKHAHYPVIVVPSNASYQPIKTIALASDLKDIYEVPVDEIEMIVNLFKAKLEIFFVGENERTINRNALGNVLLDHRLISLQPEFFTVQDEDIFMGVKILAEQNGVDMLMIIPKKHGPFHKSQSRDFVLHSSLPVIAIHKDDFIHKQ